MIYLLYYTGIRAGELNALKWRDIRMNNSNGRLKIVDSVNSKEDRKAVKTRHALGINMTKNEQSVRDIPMFETYRSILMGYKDSYIRHFNLDGISDEDFNDLYVFPYCNNRHDDPTQYFRQANVRQNIGGYAKKAGLDYYSIKSFRHAVHTICVMFRALKRRNATSTLVIKTVK